MAECISPISFRNLNEVPDEDEDSDVVEDTEHVDGSKFVFGAFLKTERTNDETEMRRYSHKLHSIDRTKEHELLKDLKEDDELHYINEDNVTGWSHDAVMKTIQDLDEEIKFTFYRKSEKYVEHDLVKETDELFIEVVFVISDLGSDDKGIIGEIAGHLKRIRVDIVEKVTYSQRLIQPRYEGKKDVRIQHGAMKHTFLTVEKGKPVMEEIRNHSDAYTFTMYSFTVIDEKEGCPRSLVAIQCPQNKKFLMCSSVSRKLQLVQDDDINKDMKNISSNSPYLFFLTQSPDGDGRVYFESVLYAGYFLVYDVVDFLRVEKLPVPPTSPNFHPTDCIRRNFTFEIL